MYVLCIKHTCDILTVFVLVWCISFMWRRS